MAPDTLEQQLIKHLTDAHAIEAQALIQMKAAPRLAGDDALAQIFVAHAAETESHSALVEERLAAHGADAAKLKDLAGVVTGAGFGAFAALQPDTPGKLLAHGFSYEHMEAAAYELLGLVAAKLGDGDTERVAATIAAQERAMADRIAGQFARAVELSLEGAAADAGTATLAAYLSDAHAIEQQSLALLKRAPKLVDAPELARLLAQHLTETEAQIRQVEDALARLGSSPSKLKDAALKLGALNWSLFFRAQPGDTPMKLAAFAYAVENLERASYELLALTAERLGDTATAELATAIAAQEATAAERIREHFGETLDATLEAEQLPA